MGTVATARTQPSGDAADRAEARPEARSVVERAVTHKVGRNHPPKTRRSGKQPKAHPPGGQGAKQPTPEPTPAHEAILIRRSPEPHRRPRPSYTWQQSAPDGEYVRVRTSPAPPLPGGSMPADHLSIVHALIRAQVYRSERPDPEPEPEPVNPDEPEETPFSGAGAGSGSGSGSGSDAGGRKRIEGRPSGPSPVTTDRTA